jgi:hypothetical protein
MRCPSSVYSIDSFSPFLPLLTRTQRSLLKSVEREKEKNLFLLSLAYSTAHFSLVALIARFSLVRLLSAPTFFSKMYSTGGSFQQYRHWVPMNRSMTQCRICTTQVVVGNNGMNIFCEEGRNNFLQLKIQKYLYIEVSREPFLSTFFFSASPYAFPIFFSFLLLFLLLSLCRRLSAFLTFNFLGSIRFNSF